MVNKSINASHQLKREFTKQATQNKEEILQELKKMIEEWKARAGSAAGVNEKA